MFTVTPVPAFSDNYFWLIESAGECWVVDPGDARPVCQTIEERGLDLRGILVTHHHPDHVGGIAELVGLETPVIGPAQRVLPQVTDPVSDGDTREIFGVSFRVIEVPGHTLNHIAYYAEPPGQEPLLFCGDTLFAGGCGRLFEGSPQQMFSSLQKLAALPDETLVYCAHEYTLANLRFAHSLEPNNAALRSRISDAENLRNTGTPTVPSDMRLERATNPFLRTDSPELIQSVREEGYRSIGSPSEVFAAVRAMKDNFR